MTEREKKKKTSGEWRTRLRRLQNKTNETKDQSQEGRTELYEYLDQP